MKKISKFLFAACGCAIASAVAVANVGATVSTVKAATAATTSIEKTVSVSTVKHGESFSVPAVSGVSVLDPRGNAVDLGTAADGAYSVKATMIGHYTVRYDNYEVDVYSTPAVTYSIGVDSASIPTYVAKGATVTLPTATVYELVDGKKVEVEGATAKREILGYDATAVDGDANKFTMGEVGNAKVVYTYAGLPGAYTTATYDVKVQDGFEDTKKPTLSVTGWKESGNVNMLYTLPIATATDDYDADVAIFVTVTDPDGNNVKVATVDEKTGYATGVADDAEDVKFDNKDVISFYPVKTGTYKVVYSAKDDAGNEATVVEKVIKVSDLKGPTITVDTSSIPENWGYGSVSYTNGDTTESLTDLGIVLPMPTYYDNNAAANLEVSVRVRDPEGNSVFKFDNLQSENPAVADEADKDYAETVLDSDDKVVGIKFNIAKYVEDIKEDKGSNYAYAGVYSVQYQVIEKSTGSTTSTALYQIQVNEEFVDDKDVVIGKNSAIEKEVILSEGDKFILPTFTMSSENDSNLTKTYTLKAGDKTIDYNAFVGGEELELVKTADGFALAYEDAQLALVAGKNTLVYSLSAKADSGKTESKEFETTVIVAEDVAYTYTTEANDDVSKVEISLPAGVESKYVGVELGVKGADGEYVDFTATIYNNGSKKVVELEYVSGPEDNEYSVEVCVYDIYGNKTVNVYTVTVAAETEDEVEDTEPYAFNSSIALGESVTWAKESFSINPIAGVKSVTAHVISGGKFKAMGSQFTPLEGNSYTVTDTVVCLENGANVSDLYADVLPSVTNTVTVNGASTKSIALDSAMPVYLALNTNAKAVSGVSAIPNAVVYDGSKNYDFSVSIKDPNGSTKTFDSYTKLATDGYEFASHGTYTLTVKAGDSTVASYSIKVGDNVAPTFEVAAPTEGAYGINSEYTFVDIIVKGETDDAISKMTFKKAVYNANGELVGEEVNGIGSTYAKKSKTVTFTEKGDYTVVYTVIDAAGNESVTKYTISITEEAKQTSIDSRVLGTVLTIVAVLAVAGVVIYLIVGRPKKKD